ncbi:MAG TPA: hypothetical protein DCY42_05715, partial [Chloroflexi bacterium]|nr:hypothetical protein [Chloroflexota bacterium]
MKRIRLKIEQVAWLPFVVAGLGGVIYALKTWKMAHSLATMILDESMYIYKGYLFAIGKYAPYQDYGPLTNHMPLSFMIPGYIQAWFGPGMETARVFAFLVGLVMLVGMWLAFTRAGGRWWGAVVVWIFVFTPAWQEVYSQGLTQGLVNVFIAWAFVLLLGEERRNWQLIGAAILMVLAVMTRVNTLPILGLMILYIYWQHGWKKGLTATLVAALVGVVILSFFWPDVLKFVSGWIPEGWFEYVELYRSPWQQQHVPEGFAYLPLNAWVGDTTSEQFKGILAFLESINFNFIPYLAVVGSLICWPRKQDWPNQYRFRLSVLLVVGWLLMAMMHIWVALSGRSCHFFCLAGYYTFFDFLGLLLLPVTMAYWRTHQTVWRQILAFVLLFGVVASTLYSAGYRPQWFYRIFFYNWYKFMTTPIPRISGGRVIWEETGYLYGLFESKLKLSYAFLIEELPLYFYWILIILLVFAITPLLYHLIDRRYDLGGRLVMITFALFMGTGALMGYSDVFYGETPNLICADNVIETHEKVAGELKEIIPEGSLLHWNLTSNMLLLNLPQMEIFPPQLNTNFNYVKQSRPEERDQIYRFGYWDQYLDDEWAREADYLLVPGQTIANWQPRIDAGEFRVVGSTAPYETCRPSDTTITV